MKTRIFLALLCLSLVFAVQARAETVLPDACGDDKARFDVNMEKDQLAPAPPEAGKAQIVFSGLKGSPTVRFGIDGVWVGADKGDSYFVVTVDPGVHHLCADWQSMASRARKMLDVGTFTAEPGKVYYFEAGVTVSGGGGGGFVAPATGPGVTNGGGGYVPGGAGALSFRMTQLSEDAGKYRVKAWKLATWKTNK